MKQKQETQPVNIKTKLEMIQMRKNTVEFWKREITKRQELVKLGRKHLKEAEKDLAYWEAMKVE